MLPILFDFLSILFILAALAAAVLTFTKKISFFNGIFITAGAIVIATVINMYGVKIVHGLDVVSLTLDEFFTALEQTIEGLSDEGMGSFLANLPSEYFDALKEIYKAVFPALLILNILMFTYAIYMIIKQILWLFKVPVHKYPKFSHLHLKKSAAYMLAACYGIPFFINNPIYAAVFSNIGIIIFGIAVFCGLSIVDFHFRQRIRNSWFRFLVYIAGSFITASGIGIVMIGLGFTAIADSFFNFRNLKPREVKKNG